MSAFRSGMNDMVNGNSNTTVIGKGNEELLE